MRQSLGTAGRFLTTEHTDHTEKDKQKFELGLETVPSKQIHPLSV